MNTHHKFIPFLGPIKNALLVITNKALHCTVWANPIRGFVLPILFL